MSRTPPETIQQTLNDPRLQQAIDSSTRRLIDHRAKVVAPDRLPNYQELRNQANQIKKHTIDNLRRR